MGPRKRKRGKEWDISLVTTIFDQFENDFLKKKCPKMLKKISNDPMKHYIL